ncbi:MAG: hypothetical protein JWM53_4966 [bacterium]|nr:hypothetical protein [bacterium]
MSLADALDRFIDALDQAQLGDEYAPGASMPWATAVQRWELYVTLVDLIDRAVRDPFGDGSAAVLLTAGALHDDEVFQLAFALSHAGEAIRLARANAVREDERHG